MRRLRFILLNILLLLGLAVGSVPLAAQTDQLCFPETQQCLDGRFRAYWSQHGGLAIFGMPSTPSQVEANRDTGVTYTTQWLERARFEWHPENAAPYDVLLGRLGDDRLRGLGRDWRAEGPEPSPLRGCLWFATTGHNVCDQARGTGFRSYWQTHGVELDGRRGTSYAESLALFGLPLTTARSETNASGHTVLTQWFERARFEWHPGNPARYKVLPGLLGAELRQGVAAPPPAVEPAPTPTPTAEPRNTSAAAGEVAYSGPITITRGGTYQGNWQSIEDPDVPAVLIATTDPVIIENSRIRGRGHLIKDNVAGVNVVVRNSYGYGMNPLVDRRAKGRFVEFSLGFKHAVIENNYLEGTAGIHFINYKGNRKTQTLKIVRNKAKNIDGRFSTGTSETGYYTTDKASDAERSKNYRIVQFVQLDKVQNVPEMEIAWNEIINEPHNSRVEDNISVYKSSGASKSPLKIYHNYIQGAYPIAPEATTDYAGGGIMLGDGCEDSFSQSSGYVHAYNNQIVSTSNYGIGILAGHDNKFYNNRIVASGYLPDGTWIADQKVNGGGPGMMIWNYENRKNGNCKVDSVWSNNYGYDNVSGWNEKDGDAIRRNDWWFPQCDGDGKGGTRCTGNVPLAGGSTVTREMEQEEYALWQNKVSNAGVAIGPR